MNVFDLFARLTLDKTEYEEGLDEAEKSAGGFGSKLATAAKVGGAALAATGTAMAAVGKQAISSYADYEQLEGGIETLFGDAAPKVMENAQKAFTTAGQSMNDYMDTSIQSAAALINSLGGDQAKAAELMDMSITDMADNVNKMGTSMEAVQNAYRGFSRGNFTMLDNLALGFAGTKEGMQQLLDKAQEISGIEYDISSYSDIVEAIHVVQDEMGITETTAKEASSTIQGSISSAKAAYQNLLTAMADETMDFDQYLNNFIDSVGTVAKNLIPRIKVVATGFVKLIKGIGPQLVQQIPGILQEVLPSVLEAAIALVQAVVTILPDLIKLVIDVLTQNLPMLITSVIQMATILITSIAQVLPELIPQIINAIIDLLPVIIDSVIGALPIILPALIKGAIMVVKEIVKALPKIMSALIKAIPRVIKDIIKAFNPFSEQAGQVGQKAVNRIIDFFKTLPYKLGYWAGEAIASVVKFFMDLPGKVWTWLTNTIDRVRTWGQNLKRELPNMARDAINSFLAFFRELPSKIWNIASNVATGFKNGFTGAWKAVGNTVLSSAKGLIDGVKRVFDERSPSKVFKQIGAFAAIGLGEGWDDEIGDVMGDIDSSLDFGAATITGEIPESSAKTINNQMTFYIQGAAGQDVNEIAKAVERILVKEMNRSEKAYA